MSQSIKQSKAKQFIDDEAIEVPSSTISDSDSDEGPVILVPPKQKRKIEKVKTRIPKKAKLENGIKYDILEEPSKSGPSKEELKNRCKSGNFNLILILILFPVKLYSIQQF